MQAGVGELGEQVPCGASALGALAAEGVLCQGDRLHGDLGARLSGGVVHMCMWVVLRAELHCGLHGDLCLVGEAVAAVGGRGAGAGAIMRLRVGLRFNLNHSADAGAERGENVLRWPTQMGKWCSFFFFLLAMTDNIYFTQL